MESLPRTSRRCHGVPQGSVLGPILFTLHLNVHVYADDDQLCHEVISMKTDET